MKSILKSLLCISIVFSFQLLFPDTVTAQEYNESVVVKGSYRPVIDLQQKLSFPAEITDTLGTMEHVFHYSIMPTRLKAMYEPSRIKAARIVGEPATRLYNNYLRLGFGNYWTPLADLYWNSTRDRKKTYGIRINHLSSWDKLPDYGPNQFGNTGVTLFGKYIVADKLQLFTDLSYEHDHNLYYGFTDSTLNAELGVPRDSISIADYRASYNVATWNFGIRNMELDAKKLGYSANVHLSDLWAVWGQNELNFNLSGDIHYGFNIKNQYKGIAYLRLEWDTYRNLIPAGDMPLGYAAISTTAPTADTIVGDIVKANPYIDFIFRGLQFRTGLIAAWNGYPNGGIDNAFCIFPDVTVSKKLMNDNLVLSLAATGNIEAVGLNAMRQVNPYIAPDVYGAATSHYDFVGHARWTLSKKLEANAEVSYSMLRNDVTFILSPSYELHNVYQPYILNDNRFTVGADVAFVNDEMITLRLGGHYYNYHNIERVVSGDALADIPYRPDWDALLAADLNYNNKWFFHLEGQLIGSMVGAEMLPTSTGFTFNTTDPLPMRYGVAAEVEYRHNRALSFFLRMDNLAFQRYYYWDNYPSQRGLFIGGLTYTIPHN